MTHQYTLQQTKDLPTKVSTIEFEVTHVNLYGLSLSYNAEVPFWFTALLYDSNYNVRAQIVANRPKEAIYVTTEEVTTSPSCIAGEIIPGTWTLEYTFLSRTEDVPLRLDIELLDSSKGIPTLTSKYWLDNNGGLALDTYLKSLEEIHSEVKTQWYAGDFHTHTIASDGQMTDIENQASAKNMGLDFYVATDHNIIPTRWSEADTIVYPGIEITSSLGHFNLLFVDDILFNHFPMRGIEDSQALLQLIQNQQGKALISVNHPFLTVWKWLIHDLPLTQIDSIELINDPTYVQNRLATHQALLFWNQLLNDGYSITGIGGSDSHLRPEDRYPEALLPSLIGDPKTEVYAKSLAPSALKDGISNGHVLISRLGKFRVLYNGDIAGNHYPIQSLIDSSIVMMEVDYDANEIDNYQINPLIQVVVDGEIVEEIQAFSSTTQYQFEDLSSDSYHWIRVQIINQIDNEVLAIANPVYFGEKVPTYQTWGDVLVDVPDSTPDEYTR